MLRSLTILLTLCSCVTPPPNSQTMRPTNKNNSKTLTPRSVSKTTLQALNSLTDSYLMSPQKSHSSLLETTYSQSYRINYNTHHYIDYLETESPRSQRFFRAQSIYYNKSTQEFSFKPNSKPLKNTKKPKIIFKKKGLFILSFENSPSKESSQTIVVFKAPQSSHTGVMTSKFSLNYEILRDYPKLLKELSSALIKFH